MIRIAIAVSLLCASLARADADIPTPDGCNALTSNSVTNRIYGICGSALVEIDGATHTLRTLPATGALVGVDPIRNRVILVSGSATTIVHADTWTTTVYPIGASGAALDPVADRIWLVNGTASTATRLDASTGASVSVSLGVPTSVWGGTVAVDPINDRVYVAVSIAKRIVEIDANSLATRSVTLTAATGALGDLAIDPLRRLLFASGSVSDGFEAVPSLLVVDAVPLTYAGHVFVGAEGTGSPGVEPGSDRVWATALNLTSTGFLSARRASDLVYLGGSAGDPSASGVGWTVNPATARSYLPVSVPGAPPTVNFGAEITTWDADPPTAIPDLPLPGANAGSAAVVFSTNRVYVSHFWYDFTSTHASVREHDEGEVAAIPLTTAVTADPVAPDGTVVVHFAATSGFATPLPIEQIYYQVDATDGAWTPASSAGPSASAVLQLAPGEHLVHAFAVDGQEATLGHINRRNPVTGPVASLSILVPAPPACSNGIDDDGDLAIDHPADNRCRGAWDNDEATDPAGCGLGAELALLLTALARRRFAAP